MKKISFLTSFILFAASLSMYVPSAQATSTSFSYTGAQQTWVVPTGVTSIEVIADGAAGGVSDHPTNSNETPGAGARIQTTISVTPGETLYLYVGGFGGARTSTIGEGSTAGYNGGGTGGNNGTTAGGGGGGASDIRQGGTALANRVVVAGGGGGTTISTVGPTGGVGGGTTGGAGVGSGTGAYVGAAGGGTPSAGGAGGPGAAYLGLAGTLGTGGAGHVGLDIGGGGGGGGYYGGGGGAGARSARITDGGGSGGGGSSYSSGTNTIHTAGFNAAKHTQSIDLGDGKIIIIPIVSSVKIHTFEYINGPQAWIVPSGITSINVIADGAEGQGNRYASIFTYNGGLGGRIQTTVPVTPGETLYFYVGGKGSAPYEADGNFWYYSGYNGGGTGGNAGPTYYDGGGGGGASDIRQGGTALANRIVVAGGGGGGGRSAAGGAGGGTTGADASGTAYGRGGTQSAGGVAGGGTAGALGTGGNGAGSGDFHAGGGGGSGYYGGGGGGRSASAGANGGGGGGSSYTAGSDTTHTQGVRSGNGRIVISYDGPLTAFTYTGAQQTWTVPSGVTTIDVLALGAEGGEEYNPLTNAIVDAGKGGKVQSTFSVTPAETLYLYIGGKGVLRTAGYNGGGTGGTSNTSPAYHGGGGGGASDIRQGGTATANRIAIASGGGGHSINGNGGGGGGLIGTTGLGTGGGAGATQSTGGAAGVGTNGCSNVQYAGGAGGGGYFGGTGGSCGGGGGGSSYSSGSYTSHEQNYQRNDGEIFIRHEGSVPATPSLDFPASGSLYQSVTPILKTTSTDPNSDYLHYKIKICTDEAMTANCQTYDENNTQTGWTGQNANSNTAHSSGTQGVYTVQTPLSFDTLYYWKSYAKDPGGNRNWGATQSSPYSFRTRTGGCGEPFGGNFSITTSCTFSGTINGVDAGSGDTNTAVLTVAAGGSLTVLSDQTAAVGSLSLTGGAITIIDGGTIKVGTPLYLPDADGDGYPTAITTTQYFASGVGRLRRYLTPDHDDTSNTIYPGAQKTFAYTGAQQTWVVPTNVTSITVDVIGANGGGTLGGKGGRTQSTVTVTPGETLYLYAGGQGAAGSGGYNGGGSGSGTNYGGGSSDVRQGGTGTANRIVIAGGGGGAGKDGSDAGYTGGAGGNGGGTTGQDGSSGPAGFGATGGGGTPTTGGTGGADTQNDVQAGGSGGGGYYGGGGASGGGGAGGAGNQSRGGNGGAIGATNPRVYGAKGGGGGSSYSSGTNTTHTQGYQTGNGQIIITM